MIRHHLTCVRTQLELLGAWLPPLALRLLLGWEFFESGWEKWRGENWFSGIQDDFPWPFNLLPPQFNWSAVTAVELIGATCLLLGLATRPVAAILLMVTVVATAAVHWPMDWNGVAELAQGYAITDAGHGNFKLPLLFIVMLLPLIFSGGGRLSLDAVLTGQKTAALHPASVPLLLVAGAAPLAWLLPPLAIASLLAAVIWAARAARQGPASEVC